jgi:tetratricopeptide (TPR) repeat protein
MSCAAFARLLGVSRLTVARWELPEDHAESRRPRAKAVEALRNAAACGASTASNELDAVDREDDGRQADDGEAFAKDEAVLLPLLEQLNDERWPRAEDALLNLLASTEIRTSAGRVLASVGAAQAHLLGRVDVRGAYTILSPILREIDRDDLPKYVVARAHVIAALLFASVDSRFFDPGRTNAHAARAEELLRQDDHDLRILTFFARVMSAAFIDPFFQRVVYEGGKQILDRAISPLARFFAVAIPSVFAHELGDAEAFLRLSQARVALGQKIRLDALLVLYSTEQTWRMSRGSFSPEALLDAVRAAQDGAKAGHMLLDEPLFVNRLIESEALLRLGRVSEADTALEAAMKTAEVTGLARYALAMAVANMYLRRGRAKELPQFADELEADGVGIPRGMMNLHALVVRAFAAFLSGDHERCIELASKVSSAPEMTPGYNYLAHDARVLLAHSSLLVRDGSSADSALEQLDQFLERRPSVPHSAIALRLQGFRLFDVGRETEARQKLESALATFFTLGDRFQQGLTELALAKVASTGDAGSADSSRRGLGEIRERYSFAHELGQLALAPKVTSNAPSRVDRSAATQAETGAPALPGFIAESESTRRLQSDLGRLSRSSAIVLITGESGVGKEVVARAVHDLSLRAKKPYLVLNCASVPRQLFESQLFGHRKGSFTGATSDSLGVIRAADGGTLLLDEIGELPLDVQPKLLRFLENNEVLPIGEQKPRRVDVRVVAATHRDLAQDVRERRFREDLFYRLNVIPIRIAPLRERPDDVLALARHFAARLAEEKRAAPDFANDAIEALRAHTWPGNVRELRNVIERAMAYAPVPSMLHVEHLRIGT